MIACDFLLKLWLDFPIYGQFREDNGCLEPIPLRWCHNDHDGVSNHQPHGCLLNRLFRRRSEKTSKLRVTGLCAGNSPGPVNSPHKGPVTRKMFPFDDVIMHWECIAMVWSHKYLCYPCCVVPSMTSLAVCFSYMHEWKLAVWSMNSNEQHGALLPNWAHCIGDSQSNIGVYCCINSIIGCWMLFRYVWN